MARPKRPLHELGNTTAPNYNSKSNGFSSCSERSDSAIGGDCFSRAESPHSTAGGGAKKSSTRRNAWGNMSYADLITQAILASPEKRLTLSQVYEWMVQNVPYFRDKGDSNSSAGWKVGFWGVKCSGVFDGGERRVP
jgi:hypothetical protein